jgi:soluble lytic murein transglycosylase-like protein
MRSRARLATIAVVSFAMLSPALAPPAQATGDIDRTQQELDQVSRDLETLIAQLDRIADEIEAIDRRLGTANAELRTIRADRDAAEQGIKDAQTDEADALVRIAEAEQRLTEVTGEVADTRDRLRGRLVQTFKYGRTTSVDIVMRGTAGNLDFHEMALTLNTIGRITDDDRGLVAMMEALAAEQRDLIRAATTARVTAVQARDDAVQQRNRIAELEAEQRGVVASINADRARRQAVFDDIEADKAKLAALAAVLADEIRRLQTANLSVILPTGSVFVGVPDWAGRLPAAGQPYSALLAAASASQGIDGRLLAALVWSESSFRPHAVSRAGAAGLSQLMPATARGLGLRVDGTVDQRFDPEANLNAGARYLRAQIVRFGSLELGLAAYNAGPGNVTRYGGIPPFAETQFYVYIVMRRYAQIVG